jgi:hypothetical protein
MGAEEAGNGLTLEGLAHRLDTQTHKLETLERENSELRSKVATLEASQMPPGDEVAELRSSGTPRTEDGEPPSSEWSGFEGKVSRRRLLSKASKAGVAAAGLVVAGALTQRDIREAEAAGQVIGVSSEPFRGGVEGTNLAEAGYGVGGKASDGWGVDGEGERAGVRGHSTQGTGVEGVSVNNFGIFGQGKAGVVGKSGTNGFEGVYGQHLGSSGYGVVGDGKGEAGAGVLGRNSDGTGVHGQSSKSGYGGVTAEHTGTSGFGVVGLGTGSTGAGVLGRNSSGIGVRGEGNNGVHGKATGGYGGLFEGGKAQLRLVPKTTVGKPTTGTHTKGEIYLDSAGTLFVCTANGTPGTWKKVSTTAV